VDSQSIKTTGVGGKERGFEGAKKVKGTKRHLLVDTQGCSWPRSIARTSRTATASSSCSNPRGPASSRASPICGWTPATPEKDTGAGWVERTLGWTAEIVRHPPKPAPEEVMMRWTKEWAKEGVAIDTEQFMPEKGPRPFLPKRWIVERTFSWLGQNRRMSKDYERLPESGEAFIYVAMSRLMARRLARSLGFSDCFLTKFAESPVYALGGMARRRKPPPG
jgi:putative transposase